MAIKGENGILYIWDVNAYKPVACLTSNSLNTAVSVIESRTKCFPGVVKKSAGIFSYTIDAEGEYIDTTSIGGDTSKESHDALLGLQLNKELITWKIDTDVTNATSIKYYGQALITDLKLTQGSGDEFSTFTATLDGDGAISQTDPND
jgi:hypothetical protein